MKPFLTICLTGISFLSSAQPEILPYFDISVSGINHESSPEDLFYILGTPDTVFDPQYECGFYSVDLQDIESVMLHRYPDLDFLVVDGEVVFRDVYFNEATNLVLKTSEFKLSHETSLEELEELFPQAFEYWKSDNSSVLSILPCESCDVEIWLHIKDDHIWRVQFWDPC